MIREEILALEKVIFDTSLKLEALRKQNALQSIDNDYVFQTLDGKVSLKDLFTGKQNLILIHNMGTGCAWCTAWADGINGTLVHLEQFSSVVVVSKDTPAKQREFAHSRGWKFRMASHGGGQYMLDHCSGDGSVNFPGAAAYVLKDGKVFKKNSALFGPGDQFNTIFPLASLVGTGADEVNLKHSY